MNERRQEPGRKAAERSEREQRLAAALRANLRRRREQARTRETALPEGGEEGPERSA
jgi:hypothetical protein